MNDSLQRVKAELESASGRVRALAKATDDEGWTRRPAAESWSAAECVAHLNLTSEAYLPLLRDALDRSRSAGGGMPRRLRRDLVGWLLWKMTGPGGRMRMPTTAAFVPEASAPKEELVASFERLQREILGMLEAAEGLPIHRVKLASPFDARAKYSVYSAFTVIAGHQHRHLDQATRAIGVAGSGGPAAGVAN